jgi:hypothetical protein
LIINWKTVFGILFLGLVTVDGFSQCKGFTKRNCLSELSPYLSNGQLNSSMMYPGEEAEIILNFNKGLSYRLLLCADEYLENGTYQISDLSDNILHEDSLTEVYGIQDLEVDRTQALKLKFQFPQKNNTTDIKRNGCVTIMVGFRDQ